MPRRAPVLLAAAVVVVAVLAFLVLRGGDDDGGGGKGEIVRGAPDRGFPLRGSLAEDDDAIAGAVARWRKVTARRAESEDPPTFEGPDPGDEVTVLWAGRVGHDDRVILEGGDLVGELTRTGQLGWGVTGTSVRDPKETPDMPVEAGGSIVLPDDGERWQFVNAGRFGSGEGLAADGLLSTNDSSPEGFVLPERAPSAADGQAEILFTGLGGRLLSPRSLTDLRTALKDGYARALWRAAEAAQRPRDDLAEEDRQQSFLREPQRFSIVWTGKLPARQRAAIISQGRDQAQSVGLGYGKVGGEQDTNYDPKEGNALLGFGSAGLAGSNLEGAVVAGTFVELDDLPYLVLAGTGVEKLHALVGDRELVRSGPAAIIPATSLARTGTAPDTVVYGRASNGDVIAPLASR